MARAIERIEKDITVLKEGVSAIAPELYNSYASYLTILRQALHKQLILASYHLCTQGYPENFLKFSLNQRQQLQQNIRRVGLQAGDNLLNYIKTAEGEEIEKTETNGEIEETENQDSKPKSNIQYPKSLDCSNPIELAKWQQKLEETIQQTLKKVSHNTNVLLQRGGILPKKIPEPILAAAAAASEGSTEVIPGPPNLLNIVIEITNDQDSEDSTLTRVMAINLRLGEIEFADSALLSGRKQIRNILGELQKLGREYEKRHRELKIAEAEAAWRASWFE